MAKTPSKLFRNLKPGDRFVVSAESGLRTVTHVVNVTIVRDGGHNYFTGKREWVVHGTYPWWWSRAIRATYNERTEVLS